MKNLAIWTMTALLAVSVGCKKEEAPAAAPDENAPAAEAGAADKAPAAEAAAAAKPAPAAAAAKEAPAEEGGILGVWHVDFKSLKESQPEFKQMSPQELQIMEQMLGSMTFSFESDKFSMNAMGKTEELTYTVKSQEGEKWVLAVTDKTGKVEDANITLTGNKLVLSKEGEKSALTLKRGAPPKPAGDAAAAAAIQAIGAAAAAGQAGPGVVPAAAPAAAPTAP